MSLLCSYTVMFTLSHLRLITAALSNTNHKVAAKERRFLSCFACIKMKWKLFWISWLIEKKIKWFKLDGTRYISQLLECFPAYMSQGFDIQHCVKNWCQKTGGSRSSSHRVISRPSWLCEVLLQNAKLNYKSITAKDKAQINTVVKCVLP